MTNGMPLAHLPHRIHLVGIGGIGMSAIARVLAMQGYAVSGSDLRETAITQGLKALGVRTYVGHAAEQIAGAELVVASSAIPEDNVEILTAQRAGIPVLKRQQFLGRLLEGRCGIAVAGTHGKTTTSAMIATILRSAGKKPGFIVGGMISAWGTNAEAGEGPYFVIEADEYDRMFLGLRPHIAVVTNIEMDHPDCFADLSALREAFGAFLGHVPPTGAIIACSDSPQVRLLLCEHPLAARTVTYGYGQEADYRLDQPTWSGQGEMCFRVSHQGRVWGEFTLAVPGAHNALNATAAALAVAKCGLSPQEAAQHLRGYAGTQRRFEVKGERAGVVVIDDYAHHPTEIRATLAAARL
ncbi:MAG: UDP-N-acetylmuramate--L-alanine ligase, partial [Chloroflexi bacterium]|nr:UDP-N-acetylmuramate--L-alanine ligase [Chloroflexota bacterium]